MSRRHRILITSVCGLAAALLVSTADAMPAFARVYGMTCNTCHAGSYPALNSFGRAVKENGYQLPAGAEAAIAHQANRQIADRLTLLERVPLAVRIKAMTRIEQDDADDPNFATPTQVDFLSGGALSKNVSYFINFGIFADGNIEAPELAYAQFHNIGGEGLANLRVGKFNILDFQFPNHRLLTTSVSPVGAVQVGNNPFILDTHHVGFDLYGRPGSGPLFYEVAVVNGTSPQETEDGGHTGGHGAASRTDSDSFKDVFARLTYTLPNKRHTVGVLGYFGKTALPNGGVVVENHDDTEAEHTEAEAETEHDDDIDEDNGDDHSAAPRLSEDDNDDASHSDNDAFRILGVDVELDLWRFNVRGALLFGNHDNPLGDGESVTYQGVMGNLIYPVRSNLLAAVRYDRVFSDDMASLEQQFLTPYVHFLLLENVHLGAEYNINLDDTDASSVSFMMDLAF